ncbi:MAG: amidohydrolase family protein [Nitrospirota bacterium]|nr:amidohydrolase family protein [Nitrospirota bacterium]
MLLEYGLRAERETFVMAVAIRNIRIIDGLGQVIERGTVLVRGDRIAAVGAARDVAVRRGTPVVDGRGLTALPGLIDCHVHLCLGGEADVVRTVRDESPALTLLKAARFAGLTLAAGVTTVRDLGARDHQIFALKQAQADGLIPGPRILAAGLALCMTGGHARFIGREADGPEEILRAVREQVAAGADVIKFIASGGVLTPGTSPDLAQLTQEELAAGMDEARRAGRRVAAHAHGAEGMKNAVRAGAHSIEHATLLDDEAGELMRAHGVFMVPTLSALATTAACGSGCGVPESAVTKARSMKVRHEASFKQALRSGIPIAMGTDAGTPFNYHGENAQELTRMVALGMSPMDAIRSATASAAELLGLTRLVGTLEPGKLADLLLVEGNPLKRIELLRDRDRLAGVMQAGRFVSGPLADSQKAAGSRQ